MLALPQGADETAPTLLCPDRGDHGMSRQKRREMRRDADRSHARPAAAVRNAEGLVQVQVADVGADLGRTAEPDLRIHVGAVHVHLAAAGVDDLKISRIASSKTPWVEG